MHALEECIFSVGFSFGYKDAYIFKIVLYMLLWRRTWQPTSVLLPEKSHGWRGPGGLQSMRSRRVRQDWATSLSLSLSCIGAGNGNPLQCSCLEKPRDRGAWWAAVYGVAQSRTRLKRLRDRKSTRLNSSHRHTSRMPSSACALPIFYCYLRRLFYLF